MDETLLTQLGLWHSSWATPVHGLPPFTCALTPSPQHECLPCSAPHNGLRTELFKEGREKESSRNISYTHRHFLMKCFSNTTQYISVLGHAVKYILTVGLKKGLKATDLERF